MTCWSKDQVKGNARRGIHDGSQRLAGVSRHGDLVAHTAENPLECSSVKLFVVNDEYVC